MLQTPLNPSLVLKALLLAPAAHLWRRRLARWLAAAERANQSESAVSLQSSPRSAFTPVTSLTVSLRLSSFGRQQRSTALLKIRRAACNCRRALRPSPLHRSQSELSSASGLLNAQVQLQRTRWCSHGRPTSHFPNSAQHASCSFMVLKTRPLLCYGAARASGYTT